MFSDKRMLNNEELNEVVGGVYGDGTKYLITITVKKGDTLGRLANRYNTTIAKIMARNPIITDKNFIRIGWKLDIMVNDR